MLKIAAIFWAGGEGLSQQSLHQLSLLRFVYYNYVTIFLLYLVNILSQRYRKWIWNKSFIRSVYFESLRYYTHFMHFEYNGLPNGAKTGIISWSYLVSRTTEYSGDYFKAGGSTEFLFLLPEDLPSSAEKSSAADRQSSETRHTGSWLSVSSG
jgi:hypothetical protein